MFYLTPCVLINSLFDILNIKLNTEFSTFPPRVKALNTYQLCPILFNRFSHSKLTLLLVSIFSKFFSYWLK